jgi:lipopolysaccharide export system permease protein
VPPILARYILRETLQTWLVVTLVLLLILVTYQFAQVLSDAAGLKVPKDAIFKVLGLTFVQFLAILTPVGLFISILLSLGRLYRDSEMSALMACGIGPAGLYRPLAILALVLAALVAWLALIVSPAATRDILEIAQQARQRADLSMIEPRRFLPFALDGSVVYAEEVEEDGSLRKVFLQRRNEDAVEVVIADRAWQTVAPGTGVRTLHFGDGRRYEGVPGSPRFKIVRFSEYGVPFEIPEAEVEDLEGGSRPLSELIGSTDPINRAELQWRLSAPLNLLVLTLLAVPLSRSSPRQGRYSGLFAGVLVYVIYVNLLAASRVWLERGDIPVFAGLWWVHGAFALVALVLLGRQQGWLRRLRRAPEAIS